MSISTVEQLQLAPRSRQATGRPAVTSPGTHRGIKAIKNHNILLNEVEMRSDRDEVDLYIWHHEGGCRSM